MESKKRKKLGYDGESEKEISPMILIRVFCSSLSR